MNSVKDTSGDLQNKQEKMAEHLQQSPWKGLNYYLEEDQALFFGRDREIQEFVKFIDRDVLTILFATSGIGKTSLLRAGVLPLLRSSGKFPVVVRLLYGEGLPSPQEQLITTLIEEAKKLKVEIEGISEVDISGMGLWEFFHSIECWSARNDLLTPVIILDQFEEIFTIGSGADEFIDELADLAENRIPLNLRRAVEAEEKIISCDPNLQNYKIILALREDYVPKLDLLRSRMPSVMRNRFALQSFDQRAAFEVISRAGGEWIDDTVAEKIVEAVAGENNQDHQGRDKVEPAYLSVMCDELYRRMVLRGESSITKELVCEEGKDILKDLYARSFEGLDDNVQFFVEDQLLTESGFRATLPVTDAVQKGIKKDEFDILVNRRLLRFEDRLGTRHVEMSHDLLTGVALENRNLRKKRIEDAERENQILEYKKRLKKSRYITLASCATLLILLSAVLIVFNCWFLEHKTYFHSVKKIYGQPRGIGKPLSEKAVRHRQTSYEITTQGRRIWFIGPHHPTVISLRAIDSHFNLTTQHNMETYLYSSNEAPIDEKTEQNFFGANDKTAQRDLSEEELQPVCQWEYFSGKNGRPIYEIGKNGNGDIVWRFIYAPSDLYDWKKQVVGHFVNKSGYPQKQRQDEADYVQISYDERGFEKLIEYRDSNGQRVSGRDGAHALEWMYDSQGRVLIFQSMSWSEDNQKYERMIDRAGNCGMRFSYNDSGWCISAESFGLDEKPCPVKDSFVVCKQNYDSWGNLIEQSFWDEKDQRAVDLMDIHRAKCTYKSGCLTEVAYYGINKKLKTIEQGYAIIRMKYDNEGNQIEWACFNDREQPCLDLSSGTHLTRRIFDDKGRVKEEGYFGIANEEPCENQYGTHGFLFKYGDHGKLEEQIYLGINGEPKENKDGYAIERMKYDDRGNQTEWACFDAHKYPCLTSYSETHMTRRVFNSNGMVVKERYFGTYWQPLENKNGEFGWTAEYDGQGNRISTVYLGPDGITPKNKERGDYSGIAIVKKRYSKQNLPVEEQYFNEKGEPAVNSNGVHYGTVIYTESGKKMELCAYDIKVSRVAFEGERVAMQRWHYDFKTGKESEILFYGVDGRLTTCDDGYAIVRMKYDNKGNQIEWACFNEQDQPCLNLSSGAHMTRNIFDDNGRVKDERYFGIDQEPCEDKDGNHGFLSKYDNHGKIEEQISLGVNGKPKENEYGYAIKRMKYDDHGNEIESACFNAQNQPCLNLSDGIHMIRKVFDDQGRDIEQRNYGLYEQPIEDMNGAFGGSCKYDARGNIIQITFWGPDDKPKEIEKDTSAMIKGINIKGVAGITITYDDQNRPLKMSYLGASGKPCLNADGVSGVVNIYNASGTSDEKYTDISGQECGLDKVLSVTILPVDSEGFKKGIRSGDIIFSYGRWDWSGTPLTEKEIADFSEACNSEIRPLHVVVYRNGEIIEREFAGGKMGVRVMDISISNDLFQKVKKSYHRYKAEKTTTK